MIQIIFATLLSVAVHASPESEAIKAQTGCYRVDFKFEETEKTDPDYPFSSKPYHEWGTEWIEVDFESESEIHLQHVLLTPHGPLKHWRQEWVKNPTSMYSFKGSNSWVKVAANSSQDSWLQRVYQVDDSPRYECAAPWVIGNSEAAWHCKTWSPLPRREFSVRDDYNILDRGNVVVVNSKGWIHHQFNDKVVYKNGNTPAIVAKEKGANTYSKLDDSVCTDAKVWWAENKAVWNDIQAVWKEVYAVNAELKLQSKVDGKVLWMHLFELADKYALKNYDPKLLKNETKEIINKFIIN